MKAITSQASKAESKEGSMGISQDFGKGLWYSDEDTESHLGKAHGKEELGQSNSESLGSS